MTDDELIRWLAECMLSWLAHEEGDEDAPSTV